MVVQRKYKSPYVSYSVAVPKVMLGRLKEAAEKGLGGYRVNLTEIIARGLHMALEELEQRQEKEGTR